MCGLIPCTGSAEKIQGGVGGMALWMEVLTPWIFIILFFAFVALAIYIEIHK